MRLWRRVGGDWAMSFIERWGWDGTGHGRMYFSVWRLRFASGRRLRALGG